MYLFVCLVLFFFEWMNECDENYLFFNFKLQCIKMHRVVVSTLEVLNIFPIFQSAMLATFNP